MLDLLADGKHLLFSTQAQLVLRGRSDAELDALTERVAALLAHWRVGYSVETAGLRWLGSTACRRPVG